jgi:hypothetical protein
VPAGLLVRKSFQNFKFSIPARQSVQYTFVLGHTYPTLCYTSDTTKTRGSTALHYCPYPFSLPFKSVNDNDGSTSYR